MLQLHPESRGLVPEPPWGMLSDDIGHQTEWVTLCCAMKTFIREDPKHFDNALIISIFGSHQQPATAATAATATAALTHSP